MWKRGDTYLKESDMAPLRTIEEIFLFARLGFGVGGVGVGVNDFGGSAIFAGVDKVVVADEGGEGGGEEDVAMVTKVREEERDWSGVLPVFGGNGELGGHFECFEGRRLDLGWPLTYVR